MDREASLLREKLEAFLHDEAVARLSYVRRDRDGDSREEVFSNHAWLVGDAARDLLGELTERARITESEANATAGHLARFVRERELAGIRSTLDVFPRRLLDVEGEGVAFVDLVAELYRGAPNARLASLARAIEVAALRALGPIREARARGDEAARAFDLLSARDEDASARVARREEAERFLVETRDLRDEVLSFLAHGSGERVDFSSFANAVRCSELDDAVPRATRARRFTELVGPLGVDRELGARVRVEVPSSSVGPGVATHVLRSPTDVRLVPSALEVGVLSELAFVEAAGAALVRALAHPALPTALARPLDSSFARTFGRVLGIVAFDARRLSRERRVPDRILDRLRRTAASIALLDLRVASASLVLDGDRTLERASDRLTEALGFRVPGGVAALVLETPRGAGERFRAGVAALAGTCALRDRYDEDFLRDPGMSEQLRVQAGRGGGMTAETFVTEASADPRIAPRRLVSWFQGRE